MDNLPMELIEKIFGYLSGRDLWNCLSVSTSWRAVANQPKFWTLLCAYIGSDPEDLLTEKLMKSPQLHFGIPSDGQEWYEVER